MLALGSLVYPYVHVSESADGIAETKPRDRHTSNEIMKTLSVRSLGVNMDFLEFRCITGSL